MKYYLLTTKPTATIPAEKELKFFEWLKHQKKTGRVEEYWAFKDKEGLAAVLRLNFSSELNDLVDAWNDRIPSEFTTEELLGRKALEAEMAKKLFG